MNFFVYYEFKVLIINTELSKFNALHGSSLNVYSCRGIITAEFKCLLSLIEFTLIEASIFVCTATSNLLIITAYVFPHTSRTTIRLASAPYL